MEKAMDNILRDPAKPHKNEEKRRKRLGTVECPMVWGGSSNVKRGTWGKLTEYGNKRSLGSENPKV